MTNLTRPAFYTANLLIGLIFLCPFAQAQDAGGSAAAVEQLRDLLDQTTTLTADVVQLQIDQDGRELQESRAELVMRKPASFHWHITEPYEELMVTDGEVIWRFEPDLEQVTIQPFDDDPDRTPVMLLNGDGDSIAASYEVSVTSMDVQGTHFVLLPRKPASLFERLSLSFRGAMLEEMQFEDSLGQQTSLTFSQVVRNQPVDEDKFRFIPPAGVEIIDHTAD